MPFIPDIEGLWLTVYYADGTWERVQYRSEGDRLRDAILAASQGVDKQVDGCTSTLKPLTG